MLCMPIFDHELGAKKICALFVGFVSAALNLDPKTYLSASHLYAQYIICASGR